MKSLVRIQETSTGNDQPDHKPGSDYGHCHGIEVMLEPALDEALPFDCIECARVTQNFLRRLQFLAGRDYLAHSRLSFRNTFAGGIIREMMSSRRSRNHKLVAEPGFPASRQHVKSLMEWRKQFLAGEWQYNLPRQRCRNDAESSARYIAQHLSQTSKREKLEVRSIQNPAIHVVESSKEQAQANDKISYIRHRDNDFARLLQCREALSQDGGRIAQVFEDVSEQNVVELSPKRELVAFQIRQLK